MNHYFLVASLPMLQFGEKPPIRLADFLSACGAALAEGEMAVLRDLLERDGEAESHPFSRAWRDRETELRNAVARLRARPLQINPEPWLRPHAGARVYIQTGVAEAFQAADPLQRERALDRLRWRILEDLAGLEPFSLEAVFSYALRLRLLWRWAGYQEAEGAAALDRAVGEAAATATGKTILEDKTQKAETV
jgi:hypothetical protein